MKLKEYKVLPKNSTINGDSSNKYDWSKFDWKGGHYESKIGLDYDFKWLRIERNIPFPWIDGIADKYFQYIHVPFNYTEEGTIFRVRPRFKVGNKRGKNVITSVKAINKQNGWYWLVEFERVEVSR